MMKKKILSLFIAAAVSVLSVGAVMADTDTDTVSSSTTSEVSAPPSASPESSPSASPEVSPSASPEAEGDKQVKVYVNNTLVYFMDQQPIIKDDFTLVPARGVFEAMRNKVGWDGDTQTVTINSENNMTRVVLNIGNDVMSVFKFTSIMSADQTDVTLEVAPQIINDRTMIPLRAISEALGTEVGWDEDTYEVHITTKDFDAEDTEKLAVSLSADKTKVEAGEEVTLSVDISNLDLYPENYVSAVTASVEYDKDNFEFVKAYLCGADGNEVSGALGASNPDYTEDSLKVAYVTVDGETALKTDGAALKMVFKAKNTNESSFALVDRYNSQLGNDATILLGDSENNTDLIEGVELIINTDPVTVNAADADEETTEEVTEETTEEKTEEVTEETTEEVTEETEE